MTVITSAPTVDIHSFEVELAGDSGGSTDHRKWGGGDTIRPVDGEQWLLPYTSSDMVRVSVPSMFQLVSLKIRLGDRLGWNTDDW